MLDLSNVFGAPAPGGASAGRRLSVRSKFLLMMLLTSLISLGIVTFMAYQAGKAALTEAAINQLTGIRAAKKQQIEYYFSTMRESFTAVAAAPIVGKAIEEFAAGFRELGRQPLTVERRKLLDKFYNEDFLPRARQNSDVAVRLEDVFPTRPAVQELQTLFIAENPNKIGGKSQLSQHPVDIAYTKTHTAYHTWFAALTERLHFYDLFLIDAETGTVVYSFAKEIELGNDMTSGPVAGTGLGQLVREVIRTRKPGDARIADFAFHLPSYNIPSAFIATPIFKDQRLVGVMAAQISTAALGAFMNDRGKWREQGLGASGAVYLVGADGLMRSDHREILEAPDKFIADITKAGTVKPKVAERMKQQGSTVLQYPITKAWIDPPLAGRSGTERRVNRRKQGTLISFAPLDIPDLNWVIIGRMEEAEVLASQARFNRNVMIVGCTLALLTTLAALWLARRFLRPLKSLLAGMERLKSGERDAVVSVKSNDEFDDLVGAFNGMATSIRQRDEVIATKTRAHEQLLKRIFPETVAERMKQGEAGGAESFPQVTAVYVIIDGFATLAETRGGDSSLALLNEIVDRFDAVAETQGVEKVKTIGDHYLAVSGLSVTRLDHARRALEFARLAAQELAHVNQANSLSLGLRVGIATGPAQAGIVGSRRFVYDIWGLAPSIARRIVDDADIDAIRLNAEAFDQITDKAGIGEDLVVRTKSLGAIKTHQLRLTTAASAKAAE